MSNHAGPADQSESLQQPNSPQLCTNNCGFFANSSTTGLCSKCFRDKEAMSSLEYQKQGSGKESFKGSENQQQKSFKQLLDIEQKDQNLQVPDNGSQELNLKQNSLDTSQVKDVYHEQQGIIDHDLQIQVNKDKQQARSDTQLGSSQSTESKATSQPSSKPSRCPVCKKKTGITGFKCKCDKTFCASHRLAESHDCTFDYKGFQRQKLAENNPLIIGSKVEKL